MREDPIGILRGMNHLYVYVQNNPLGFIDPLGLDNVGCDGIPDFLETPCRLECCAKHDECYDKNDCSASSWYSGNNCSEECDKCNKEVANCFLKCGFSNEDDPNKPNYYCAAQHRYVKIPGDFPDYKTAKKHCKSN